MMFLQDHWYFRGWVFPVSVCGLLIWRVLLPTCCPSMTPSKIAITMNFIPSWSHSLSIKMMNLLKFCYFCCFCTKKPKGKYCYMFISFSVVKSKSYCVTGGLYYFVYDASYPSLFAMELEKLLIVNYDQNTTLCQTNTPVCLSNIISNITNNEN